jgi:predicted O-methyltransferase YrrM
MVKHSGFHGDAIAKELVRIIIKKCNVTSFIETGTYHGFTIKYVANLDDALPIFTCELNKSIYKSAKKNLKNLKNVTIRNMSSEKFLVETLKKEIGKTPLFYLDAHWYKYWPLYDELTIITENCDKAIIIIDDFEVQGRKDFKYYTFNDKKSNLAYIKPILINRKDNKFTILFPSYSKKDAKVKELDGYIIIFQNMRKDLERVLNDDFVKTYFSMKNY